MEETKDANFMSRFNGKDSLDISITKDSQSNAVTISKEIEKVTKEINEKYDQQESVIYISSADLVENSVQYDDKRSPSWCTYLQRLLL